VIPIRWDDRTSVLTIGARQGSYPGMVEHRNFRVVIVGSGHRAGVEVTGAADAEIAYDGKEMQSAIKECVEDELVHGESGLDFKRGYR